MRQVHIEKDFLEELEKPFFSKDQLLGFSIFIKTEQDIEKFLTKLTPEFQSMKNDYVTKGHSKEEADTLIQMLLGKATNELKQLLNN